MKKYIKNNIIKDSSQIIVYKDDAQIINPNEAMIIDDGWIEYNDNDNCCIADNSYEDITINELKELKINEIEHKKDLLKCFILNGEEVNITTDTLNKLTFRVMGESISDKSKTTLWFNYKSYNLDVNDAMKLLYSLQMYFGKLYDITEIHKNMIKKLNDRQLIMDYCYETGYPNKVIFKTNNNR